MRRILEEDLQLPALYLINLKNGELTTSKLSSLLRSALSPSGEDLDILHDRGDDKFSQIVRNLTGAERPFVKNGYIARENERNKPLYITDKGREYLNSNIDFVKYLFGNNFKFDDMIDSFRAISSPENKNKSIRFIDENITIIEGQNKVIETIAYQRSNKLRNIAIENYMSNGRIKCKVCCFDFEDFYGDYGKGFIEIHHQKPVFMFNDEDLEQKIEDALANVIPVCSNCHRMIHRTRSNPLSFQQIKSYVNSNLNFCKEVL